MKFEIAGVEKVEETPITLTLEEGIDRDNIVLTAVKDGKRSQQNVLVIYSDGTIQQMTCVNPDLGFQLDERGRVKLRNE